MDPMAQLDPAELVGDVPEQPSSDINHLRLKPSTATDHNHAEVESVQNLDPVYLNILSYKVRESTVNAVWNQLLQEVFQYPGFVLAPEFYTPNDQRVDLVACGQTHDPDNPLVPVFAYEGKEGPITPTQFFNAIAQASRYLPYMYRLRNGRYYGMVCAGRKVVILEYAQGGGRYQMKQVYGKDLSQDVTDNIKIWDIEFQAEKIDEVLGAIFQEVLRS